MRSIPLLAAVLVATAAIPAAANHGDDRFSASGHIAAGNPGTQFRAGASEGVWGVTGEENPAGVPLEGTDGDIVELPDWAGGHPIWVNGTSPAPHDLDVYFYAGNEDPLRNDCDFLNPDEICRVPDATSDPNHNFLGSNGCATPSSNETCEVPSRATYAAVDLWSGADVDYEIVVTSGPDSGDDGGLADPTYTVPPWFTWDHADLDVVIVPPATGPAYDEDLWLFPAGTGLATDSPYVDATEDAIQAWDQALSAYAANHSSATYLADFTFDVSVVGADATVTDLRQADIRITYGVTGGPVLGVALATQTDGQRFEQCDISNQQWLVTSFTVNDAYNVYGHEFGHCLGLSHPPAPPNDIMGATYDYRIGDPDNPRICISTLDAKGLAEAYAWMGDDGEWAPPPDTVEMPRDDYDAYPAVDADPGCPNP